MKDDFYSCLVNPLHNVQGCSMNFASAVAPCLRQRSSSFIKRSEEELMVKRTKMLIVALAMVSSCGVYADSNEILRVLTSKVEGLVAVVSNRIERQCGEIVQEQEKRFSVISNSITTSAANVLAAIKEDGESKINAVITERGFYEARYTDLKAAHDRFMGQLSIWLAVIGVLVAIFGVTMPIVVSFHQHKSFDRELNKLRNEMKQDRIDEMRQLYKDCVVAQKMMLSKYVLWFDNKLMAGATPANVQFLTYSLSSIMLGFHQLMECAMRSRDERLVKEQIGAFKGIFDKVRQHNDPRVKNMWSSASAGLKTVIVKKDDEAMRGDYESVLKVGSESFEWL